ncbi:UNKNOWN [Stylonychia lemnae]|uniref:Uncharacterized protein n=1 Tax=Stylonychia lemnae TaxID=5949 RepID=A0A078B0M6_STYLE|nr:UNKNOWN [Stylonychia lemnae]|eukprot:CDW88094.1 UNKNOWN [Stylonychia lemnae]
MDELQRAISSNSFVSLQVVDEKENNYKSIVHKKSISKIKEASSNSRSPTYSNYKKQRVKKVSMNQAELISPIREKQKLILSRDSINTLETPHSVNKKLSNSKNVVRVDIQIRSQSLFQSRRQSRQFKQLKLSNAGINSQPFNVVDQQVSTVKTIHNSKTTNNQINLNLNKIKPVKDDSLTGNNFITYKQNKDLALDLSPASVIILDKTIQNERIDVHIPNQIPQTTMNNNNKKSLFNCADSNDMSKTEKSLLEEFKKFLQIQQEKQAFENKYDRQSRDCLSSDGRPPRALSNNERSRSINRTSSMKHCLNCVQLLSRGLSTAFCKEHQYARSKIMKSQKQN